MKLSFRWLQEQTFFTWQKNITVEDLTQKLPLRGFEVEEVICLPHDTVLDLSITPNRGDCLSMRGIAREIACLYELPFRDVEVVLPFEHLHPSPQVLIKASKACSFYAGQPIGGLSPHAKTPKFIEDYLTAVGMEILHPVVDICNYVMLLLGQPMHAFDYKKIQNLQVRFAKEGEKFEALNGQMLSLDKNTLVVADSTGVQAMAGVIGGLSSSVTENTTDFFLESAHFLPEVIAGRARQYGLQTEGAQRFERGVDPHLPLTALKMACELIATYLGGKTQAAPVIAQGKPVLKPKPVRLRHARIFRLLGVTIPSEQADKIFAALQLPVLKKSKTQWLMGIPSFRFDITQEADFIEELARVIGYDAIPVGTSLLQRWAKEDPAIYQLQAARDALAARGYQELISYSFISENLQALCFPEEKALHLKNPLSSELAVMRTSLWPSLLMAWQHNKNRQQTRARYFELGAIYSPKWLEALGTVAQPTMLAGLMTGDVFPEQWGVPSRPCDFFDLKGDIFSLFLDHALICRASSYALLHPTQQADILLGEKIIGRLGRLHPSVQQQLALEAPVYLFEIQMQEILLPLKKIFKPISRFPAVQRDFAFLIPKIQPIENILTTIRGYLGERCVNIQVFDLYEGRNISVDQKSVAFRVSLQALDRTLEEAEVQILSQQIITLVTQKFEAQLRE